MSKRILILLCLLTAPFITIAETTKTPDPCNSIKGQWVGKWRQSHNNRTCRFVINANIDKQKNYVLIDVNLSHGMPILFCPRADNFIMTGVCKKGTIYFTMDMVKSPYSLTGNVSNDTITLSGDLAQVELSRKK